MALQFLPMLLLGLHAGALADRLPKRRILLITQTLNGDHHRGARGHHDHRRGATAAYVYAFALASGVVFAFDSPARQAFVTEVVSEDRLRAAISLNAAVFQATRLIGPAIASVLIATAGTGWVFAVNAACYLGPTIGLLLLRPADLQPAPGRGQGPEHACGRPSGTCAAARTCCGRSSWSGCSARSALTAMRGSATKESNYLEIGVYESPIHLAGGRRGNRREDRSPSTIIRNPARVCAASDKFYVKSREKNRQRDRSNNKVMSLEGAAICKPCRQLDRPRFLKKSAPLHSHLSSIRWNISRVISRF